MAIIENFTTQLIPPLVAVIQSGQSESNIINPYATTVKTIFMPAAFDGTAITFKISYDGLTFYNYYNIDNILVSITCSAGRAYGLGAIDFYSIQHLKIVSNATESAERQINLLTRSI